MENKIKVIKDGEEKTAELIATFRLEDFDKDYVLYTFNEKKNDNIKILASTLEKEDDKYVFSSIASEEEWSAIKEVIKSLSKKGEV